MAMPFSTGDIITGIIGIGLLAKGIADKHYSSKTIYRPCAVEHMDLERRLDTLLTILNERKPR
jgi:hypothetical protein